MGERFWIGTSWKMNKTLADATEWVTAVTAHGTPQGAGLFVVPPFTALAHVAALTVDTGLLVGTQDVHAAPDGPHTGDISAHLAADAGAVIAELGHQERRRDHRETDDLINQKAHRAYEAGLRPLLCVGDLATDRTWGTVEEALARQVKIGLHAVPAAAHPLIAYEPAWAIGETGTPASLSDITHAHQVIRRTLAKLFSPETSATVPILYGGNVSRANCRDIATLPFVDGLFVGRAALDSAEFTAIIDAALSARLPGAS